MPASIINFIAALNTPDAFFNTLTNISAQRDQKGAVAVTRTSNFSDVMVRHNNQNYMLSLPLNGDAIKLAQRTPVKVRVSHSDIFNDYRVLPMEMNYVTSQGDMRQSDILLQEVPNGRLLSSCISELDPAKLIDAVYDLQQEFNRINLVHSHLTAENIIIDSDYNLYPIRL